ncbi:MAG: hypothetical protein Q4D33_09465, partial [Prevotellaceae bacterium]|nr:hypothetical protein [Prevotellaceae bacterium]
MFALLQFDSKISPFLLIKQQFDRNFAFHKHFFLYFIQIWLFFLLCNQVAAELLLPLHKRFRPVRLKIEKNNKNPFEKCNPVGFDANLVKF